MSRADWPVTLDPVFGCWVWRDRCNERGYPVIGWRGNAGKHVYEAEVGVVPAGLELDHLCRVRRCVAPHHREAVTHAENMLRISWRYRCRRKMCSSGHSLADALVTGEAGRLCRTCAKEWK